MPDTSLPPWAIAMVLMVAPFMGSFAALVADRLPEGRGWITGRSRCGACQHPLGPRDLVPTLSFLARRGRCRYCGAPIPRHLPLMEGAALLIALLAVLTASGAVALAMAGLGWWLLVLARIDLTHWRLPDSLTLPLVPIGLALAWALPEVRDPLARNGAEAVIWHLAAAGFGFLLFEGLRRSYRALRGREGLGGGDSRLMAGAGAFTGPLALPLMILMAALSALLVAGIARLAGRTVTAGTALPFGPVLALALWLTWHPAIRAVMLGLP
ncbi:prepilin peptidase [Yunchengibacter salinarum]|uniref:prepilin peptidase n=1 Tax=Yunchengibacter salinarum TaxID=3133399 RepID=UPI0035B5EE61